MTISFSRKTLSTLFAACRCFILKLSHSEVRDAELYGVKNNMTHMFIALRTSNLKHNINLFGM